MPFNYSLEDWAKFGALMGALDILVMAILFLFLPSYQNDFSKMLSATFTTEGEVFSGIVFGITAILFSVFNWLWLGLAYSALELKKFFNRFGIQWTIAILAFIQIIVFGYSTIMTESIILAPILIYLYVKAFVATKLFKNYLPF